MENILTDASIREEDREIDIAAYTGAPPAAEPVAEEEAPAEEDDELPVDVDKVFGEQ
jgi:small subunit ribosomal protein S2